ncbi:VanZ family protein [Haloarchaeobius sp. DT45]|uniref:VanZ family protein n=1 Tax=Haloarchaeobius sp. DT45 TaxID=3446116 RepID=UPI003F6AAB68
MKRRPWSGVHPWVLVLAWGGAVLLASVVEPPGSVPDGGAASTGFGPFGLLALDKLFHAVGYAVLAVLAARARRPRTLAAGLAIVAVVALFGFGVEVVQLPIPARSFDLADAAVNTLGATVGVVAWAGYERLAGAGASTNG